MTENHSPTEEPSAAVIVASTRAASGEREDGSAPLIIDWFARQGLHALPPWIVPDGEPVQHALRDALGQGARLVITTGGTGVTSDDLTPEMTLPLLEKQLPGVMEAIRARGLAKTPHAALSRGYAGTNGTALVLNLPGSRGGIKDGLAVLQELLPHVLDQLGGSHEHCDCAP